MKRYAVTLGAPDRTVEIEIRDEAPAPVASGAAAASAPGVRRLRVTADGREHLIELAAAGPLRYTWLDGVRVVNAEVEPVPPGASPVAPAEGSKVAVTVRGESFSARVKDAQAVEIPVVAPAGRSTGPVVVRAPMPGRVVKLLAQVGGDVKAGAGVVVVEAMKMENELRAPRDGRVQALRVSEGQAVEANQELVVIE